MVGAGWLGGRRRRPQAATFLLDEVGSSFSCADGFPHDLRDHPGSEHRMPQVMSLGLYVVKLVQALSKEKILKFPSPEGTQKAIHLRSKLN